MATRCCGERVCGGVYSECELSPFGRPLEDFVICPPIKLTRDALDALGLTPVGVKLIEREGVWHVLDWVGSQHYENVCDVLEEIRALGMSRRLPVTLEFEKLSKRSRHILVHARGWIDNAAAYHAALAELGDKPYSSSFGAKPCPREVPGHDWPEVPTMCAQSWWQDVEGGEPIGSPGSYNAAATLVTMESVAVSARATIRRLPSFYYIGLARPEGVEPHYTPAMVASFPISRLVVIRDPQGGTHERALKAAGRSALPTELEDE